MTGLPLLALIVGALGVTALCRRVGASAPLVLVVVGLVVSFVPGVPEYRLDPQLVLFLVLPPLLYSAALDSSYLRIRENLRPIGLLAFGLVLFTAVVVGLVARAVVPGLSLPAALVLGAVVAPPDAVAAAAIGRRLGVNRRIMTILAGESLLNDATALTLYRVAVTAAAGAGISLAAGIGQFAFAAVGGAAIGYLIGILVHRTRLALGDAVMESALGLLVPFTAYLVAETVQTSGVLAVVVAGLYLGHHAPEGGFATRLQDQAVWKAADAVLEAFVFALIGLQLKVVVSGVARPLPVLSLALLAVLAATVVARFAWVFPATYLPRALFAPVRRNDPAPPWRYPAVISWAGMRGVVTLAAAFGLPAGFPARDVVLLLAFGVTVGTLLLQGLTLGWVIRRLDVRDAGSQADALAEAAAQQAAADAAVSILDDLGRDGVPEHVTRQLHGWAQYRSNGAWERLGRPADELGESPSTAFRRLRRAMLTAERDTFVRYRNEGRIGEEVLRRVLRELDLEEAMLQR